MKNVSKINKSIQTLRKLSSGLASVTVLFFSLPSVASIPQYSAFNEYELINSKTKELNLSVFANIQIMIEQNQIDLSQYIPYSQLQSDDDSRLISRKILKKTLRTISENDSRYSGIARSANDLSPSLSTGLHTSTHSFSFKLKALETQALVTYEGSVKAKLSYDIQESEAVVEVSKIVSGKTIAFNHIANEDGNADTIGIRWSF